MRFALIVVLLGFTTLSACRCDSRKPGTPQTAAPGSSPSAPAGDEGSPPSAALHTGAPKHGPQRQLQSAVRFYAQLLANKDRPDIQPAIRQSFQQNVPTARAEVLATCQAAGRDQAACEKLAHDIEGDPARFPKWENPAAATEK